jgi:HSP20 family protein
MLKEIALRDCTELLAEAWSDLLAPRGDPRGLVVTPRELGASAFAVPLELWETGDAYVVHVEVPGIRRGRLRVTCDERSLLVTGERREHGEGHLRYTERAYGVFSRSLALPGAIRCHDAQASYADGVLVVVLPKARAIASSAG